MNINVPEFEGHFLPGILRGLVRLCYFSYTDHVLTYRQSQVACMIVREIDNIEKRPVIYLEN
jgi:hypothetical protein